MTGSQKSRRSRRAAPGKRSAPSPSQRGGWRRRVDTVGGLPLVISVVAAIAVVVVLIVANRPASDSSGQPYEPIARSETHGQIDGKSDAPVRIVVFADFQCPFCGRFSRDTEPVLRTEFVEKGIATIEFRNFAFLGDESVRAAEAAECAGQQGFFWEYHDILFQKQPADGRENIGTYSVDHLKQYAAEMSEAWATLAPERRFDNSVFGACVDSRATASAVEQQTKEGRTLGVQSTPSFLINGRLIAGAQPIDAFRRAIEQAQGVR